MKILTHGGAGSDPAHTDATDQAAAIAHESLQADEDPLDAACHATAHLEDDPRFNAGKGSHLRSDGETIQMDAACMSATGTFGAVAILERVRHPVYVARHLASTENIILAGQGAQRFARRLGMPDWEPTTPSPSASREGHDTVGCVLHAGGDRFAAALSSGGTKGSPVGRVGDVPLPGAGLHAGPAGAVCATGHGETIARRFTALRAYERLERGDAASHVVEALIDAFPSQHALGLLIVTHEEGAGGSNREMAFTELEPAAIGNEGSKHTGG